MQMARGRLPQRELGRFMKELRSTLVEIG
jgi:hypothetical protein